MVLFVLAVIVALIGVGVYDLYNPGRQDLTMLGYHFVAVPAWVPVALGAAVPLALFLLHALWTGLRIWLLKGAARRAKALEADYWPPVTRRVELRPVEPWPVEPRPVEPRPVQPRPVQERPAVAAPAPAASRRRRASQAPPQSVSPQPAPKRSWLTHRD